MKKIAFVTPWFGLDIPGGAEAELRGLTSHLSRAGIELEILTTCVEKFGSDWSKNYHPEGATVENDITVRRFKVRKRDKASFDAVNYKLMRGILPLTDIEERIFVEEMINSPALYDYMDKHRDDYQLFVFIPYMFGTTYYGMQVAPEKSVMIPCLHDESYIHMRVYQELFPRIAGMIFHAYPEYELAKKEYDLKNVKTAVLGEGVDTDLKGDPERFREKYRLDDRFVLYAGRKDSGKKVDTLIRYYSEFVKRNPEYCNLKLVLIGGGNIDIPDSIKNGVIDLGFVDIQDKYDAYAAATVLCQPSFNESFSLVIMESWLAGRPVLVADQCEVTKRFCIESNGGLWFANYFDFEAVLGFIISNPDKAEIMGNNGRTFVLNNFSWSVIVNKYKEFINSIVSSGYYKRYEE